MRLSRDPAARRRLVALCVAAVAATLAGVVVGSGAGGDSDRAARPAAPKTSSPRPTAAVDRLSLERQLGQLLVISFDGVEPPGYVYRLLREGHAGGVILFGKNLPDAGTLRASTGRLQRSARGGALIATDQEGGSIRSVAFAPPESSQGALATREAAAGSAAGAARELRRAGINVNLAPVADVAVGGSVLAGRAYPGDAAAVGPLVEASVTAHSRRRVAATAKHFPGLGRARQNTDDAPVTIDAPRAQLERADLQAFGPAIRAGVPLVMTSHALYPAYDRDRIASQSPILIERVLRRGLGFRGAVITDSMEAEAVTSRSDVATAAERAVEAGTDLVLMTGSGSWKEVYPRLLRRARASAGFRARVRDAAARVIALKRWLGLRPPTGRPPRG